MLTTVTNLVAALVAISVSSGRHHLTYRQSADHYSVIGEGRFRTVDCTVKAVAMDVQISDPDRLGRRWVTFIDDQGEVEAECLVDDGPEVIQVPPARAIIVRGIATIEGAQ